MSLARRKPAFCICVNKDADQLRGNCEADQRLCFRYTDEVVQFLYFLNPKFQASSHLLWRYSPVCVGPGRKPRRPVFSERGSGDDWTYMCLFFAQITFSWRISLIQRLFYGAEKSDRNFILERKEKEYQMK